MEMERLSGRYHMDCRLLDKKLRVEKSFDILARPLEIAGKEAMLYYVNGFAKSEVMEKVIAFLLKLTSETANTGTAEMFINRNISYIEAEATRYTDTVVTDLLSGKLCLISEWFSDAVLIEAREYPSRGVSEPDDDRALRGARDSFVETIVCNTALIRRRIRDPALTMEGMQIGKASRTDVVLCYMEGRTDEGYLKTLRRQLSELDTDALTLGQQSLAERLVHSGLNPFPRFRYTERPDTAAASVLEGSVLILVDTSPAVMILPVSIFQYTQDINDFYFPPVVGSYLRLIRILSMAVTLFFVPVWYLLVRHPEWLSDSLSFLIIGDPGPIPVFLQILLVELVLDGLKLASLNTPNALSQSFSVIGGLILGDFAIQVGWMTSEIILYMAFVSIANFAQPSFELGYAFKLWRMILVALTALFDIWGFVVGILLLIYTVGSTRSVGKSSGKLGYLYPLIPFDGRALVRLLLRMPEGKP